MKSLNFELFVLADQISETIRNIFLFLESIQNLCLSSMLYNNLFICLHSETHFKKFVCFYVTVSFSNDACARNAYGLLLEHQKLYKSAEEQFLICLKFVAEDAEKDAVLINLSRILIVLGKYIEAFKVCQKVKNNTFKSHCQLALALFKGE